MNNKNNMRTLATRKKICDSLKELLKHKDFLDISVSELSEAAGVTRSTFYSHYDTVADVLEEVMGEVGKDFFSRFIEENFDSSNPFTLDHLVKVMEHIRDNKTFFKAYLCQSFAPDQLDWAFGELLNSFFRPMMQNLEIPEEDIEYYFSFFRGGFLAIIEYWLAQDCRRDPVEVSKIILNLLDHPEYQFKR